MRREFFGILLLPAISLIALSSCGPKQAKITESPAVKVDVMVAAPQQLGSLRSYSGSIESGEGTEVSFNVPGTIKSIAVKPGDNVRAGQLIATLDDRTYVNSYNIALATLNEAKDAYARLQKLHEANGLSDLKWNEMQTKLQQAQNAADIAKRAVDDCRIYAPISGRVIERSADAGQTVLTAFPVMKIAGLNEVKISISVPEAEISAMTPGRTARVVVEALNGLTVNASLAEQGVVANPLSRAYDVKFRVANPDGRLLPGMLCTLSLNPLNSDASAASIILPPQAVLLSADNQHFVWTVKEGKAQRKFVTQGGMTAEGIIIIDGIVPGDSIITAGMQKVSNGTAIKI